MRGVGVGVLVTCILSGFGAQAQELSFKFNNPSFGGNPFYSDHLLGVASAQRPERPAEDEGLSEGEQFARQIQSRILSALSSSIVEAITGSDPGTSGEFTVGDQTIFFERSLTEIRLTITDNVTGEVTTIVLPVIEFDGGSPFGAQMAGGSQAAGGSSLLGSATSPTAVGQGSLTGGLIDSSPLGESLFGGSPLTPPISGQPGN